MKSRYDRYILDNIIRHYKYEPFSTLDRLEEYMINYPLDNIAYIHYAKILISVGKFDEALVILDFIKRVFPDIDGLALVYFRIKALMFKHQYEEALNLYRQHKEELLAGDPNNQMIELVYDLKVLGNAKEKWGGRYLYNQMIDYDYDLFLSHVQKHTAEYNETLDEPNKVVFNSYFPLDRVLKEIQNYIPSDNRLYFGFYQNLYAFKYDDNGKIGNKSVNYFRVITVHDTNSLITMYPLHNGANLPYIDLNYMQESSYSSAKRLSRVDRFYQKYGIQDK